MALVIIVEGNSYQWHIGQKLPISDMFIDNIKEIQADGDELEYIKSLFLIGHRKLSGTIEISSYTIPIPHNKKVVRWYGDIAKTIVGNL